MKSKSYRFSTLGISVMVLLFMVLGAASPTSEQFPVPDFSQRINRFTMALLKQQACVDNAPANKVLSPQSVFQGLAMSYIASGGETRRELATVFNFPEDNAVLIDDLTVLRRQLVKTAQQSRLTLNLANSLWLDETYAVFQKAYVDKVKSGFDSQLHRVEFRQAEKASQKINAWVSDKTRGKIPKVVSPEDFASRSSPGVIDEPGLVTVNVVYFKADWASRFDKDLTSKSLFHIDTGTVKGALMMRQRSPLNYAENDQFKLLEIPYIGGDCSMYVILPKENLPVARLMNGLLPEEIFELRCNAVVRDVDVWLPKFELKSHVGMKKALSNMGVSAAFEKNRADFDRMIHKKAEAYRIYISEIYHDAWIDVHEQGTEAAAATTSTHYSIGCSAGPMTRLLPAEFHADHPFVFLIVHNVSRSILFTGWISNPD